MSDFYFFCDLAGLAPQGAGQAYGPVSSDPNNKFRVTNLHTSKTSNNKVYAISDGEAFVIPNTDDPANLLNLILKPSKTNEKEGLPSVKYIIYKGILKSSLITGSEVSSALLNDLTKSVWDSQSKRNVSFDKSQGNPSGTTSDVGAPASASSLLKEIGVSGPGETPIYRMFFKDEEAENQIPQIKAGWHIGDFAPNATVGMEFITDQIGFEPDLNFVSTTESIISATVLQGGATHAEIFSHWNEKEKILNFIDPCAFFGSFQSSKLKVFSSGNKSSLKIDDIYSLVLSPLFVNKNRIYIDIRNEYDYSYDYFDNYSGFNTSISGNNIYIQGDQNSNLSTSFPEGNYNTFNNYQWPILTIEIANIVNANPSDKISLKLAFPRMNNPNPIMVIMQGEFGDTNKTRFSKSKSHKFLDYPLNQNITEKVKISIPNYSENNSIELISSLIRIKYLKEMPQCPEDRMAVPLQSLSSDTSIGGYHDLDNIFTPFDMVIPWGDSEPSDAELDNDNWVYFNETYTDVLRTSGEVFMGHSGIARDDNGDITLFCFSTKKIVSTSSSIRNSNFSVVGKKGKVRTKTFLNSIKEKFGLQLNSIDLNLSSGVETVYTLANVELQSLNSFEGVNHNDFSFLKIAENDFSIMLNIISGTDPNFLTPPFLPGYKVHLGFALNEEGFDSNGIGYYKLEFVLRGYGYTLDNAGNVDTTVIKVKEIPTGLFMYRLKRTIAEYSLEAIDTSGKGYFIQDLGTELNFPYPDGTIKEEAVVDSAGNTTYVPAAIPKKKINSTLYLYRADNLTPEQFCDFMAYIRDNIQQVWNSTTNKGLLTTYDPVVSTPVVPAAGVGSWKRPYIIDASGVHIKEASAKQFTRLQPNECLIFTGQPSQIGSRSHIDGGERTGSFYYSRFDPTLPYFEDQHNMPAHEFGHILGLGDRYVYPIMYSKTDDFDPGSTLIAGQEMSAVAKYVSKDVDLDYATRYGWFHNLMSTIRNVPATGGDPDGYIETESTFIRFHEHYRPEPDVVMATPDWLQYSKICVFITEAQFDIIMAGGKEEGNRWAYFKNIANRDFQGTFAGHMEGSHNADFRTDDFHNGSGTASNTNVNTKTYEAWQIDLVNSNDSDWNTNYTASFTPDVNNYDHDIEERSLLQPGSGTSVYKENSIDGYYSPYIGKDDDDLDVLKEGEPIPDDSITDINPPPPIYPNDPNRVTYYSLELGGHIHEQDGINNVRNSINFLRQVLAFDVNNMTPAQDNLARQAITTYANLREILTGPHNTEPTQLLKQTDEFKDFGEGNDIGIGIWRESFSSKGDGEDIEGRNTSSPLPTPLGILDKNTIGYRPYNDYLFKMGSTSDRLIPKSNPRVTVPSQYIILYNYYINRRILIDLMQEGI